MKSRSNVLLRLRRWKTGAARHIVASFVVAYLLAGVVPCSAAASPAMDDINAAVNEHVAGAHADHGQHAEFAHHGHEDYDSAASQSSSTRPHDRTERCPHCPAGTAVEHASSLSSCRALEDLGKASASHAKDDQPPPSPSFVNAAFTLPPPLASPAPPPRLRGARVSAVPLNVQHCVFLI
jgi:hypothetical protein